MTITQQQIIALAVEAGLAEVTDTADSLPVDYVEALAKFAKLAAQQERNACLAEVETGIWIDKTTEEVLADITDAIRARSETQQQPSGWHRAVDEEMVLTHLGVADPSDSYETAKKKLNDLIAWHVAVATDPTANGGSMLVPSEPTRAMLDAAKIDLDRNGEIDPMLKYIWKEMIGAAK